MFSPAAACTAAHQGTRPCRSTRQRWSASPTDSRRGPRSVKTFTSNPDPDAPPYQVAASKALYELRIYGAYYVTRAGYSNREQGLASLMGYVEGGNERGTVFPATQLLQPGEHDPPRHLIAQFLSEHVETVPGGGGGGGWRWAEKGENQRDHQVGVCGGGGGGKAIHPVVVVVTNHGLPLR